MDWNVIGPIIGAAITVISLITWRWIAAKQLLKETYEALKAVHDAVEDDKITAAEAANILKEGKDVVVAAKKLIWG